ncbi:MAG: DAK2 domain-containing protein, partial [Ilumatobacteraceae bacterium]
HGALTKDAGAQSVLTSAADAWSDKGGGTSGAIWGVILRTIGERVGNTDAVDATAVAEGLDKAKQAVMDYGKATVGDKTMVDALVPFAETLTERVAAGDALTDAWAAASAAAQNAADGTADMMPGMGRARSHGEKALGVADPGAVSLALIAASVLEVLRAASDH